MATGPRRRPSRLNRDPAPQDRPAHPDSWSQSPRRFGARIVKATGSSKRFRNFLAVISEKSLRIFDIRVSSMAERRTDSRSRSFLGAKIVFNSRNSSMDCLIRNISPTGARLLLSSAVVIPDEFELQIPKQGRSFRARLAWRRAD